MKDTQRPRRAYQRPYRAGEYTAYTPLQPAPSGEVIFEMNEIPKYPESTCSRVPSQPPPYEEIDSYRPANEDIYNPHPPNDDNNISRSNSERAKKKAKMKERFDKARIWIFLAFMLLIITGVAIGGPLGAAKGKEKSEKSKSAPVRNMMQTSPAAATTVTNTVTVTQTASPEEDQTTFNNDDDDDTEEEEEETTYYVVPQAQPKPQSQGLLTRIWRWLFG
ncbi:hypothetical protein BJY00DRAFT_306940 [Aspergillus carlsbadensis]|nr:hypothetical protein BJY00DRAFT_306940 [Aspergillus carlsbadensis]